MKPHRLLEPLVSALEQIDWFGTDQLRFLFAAIAQHRPDLLHRSLFVERSRKTTELEKLMKKILNEVDLMDSTGTLPDGLKKIYLGNLRFNHSTGKLHIGHSNRSTKIFP